MFKLPINDSRVQSLTSEQIDFMMWSELLDNPEKLKKVENYYYDPEFDDYINEVENEAINGTKRFVTLSNGQKVEYGGKLESKFSNIDEQSSYLTDDWEEV